VLNLDIGSLNWLILSAIPVFLVGLLEDLGHHMQPIKRLLASAFSGVLVIIFFKTWVNAVGIPPFDILLVFAPLGILFTLFATIGVVNGFNLVDGLNGFASYITISSAIALSVVAFHINNIEVLRFLFILSACVIGFLMLNFPLGRIFLGDAGAYVLGHLLVWCGILIVYKTESVSPFSILLIFFWPVAETLLSIWRRWWHNKPADRPDRLHYHQLVMRFLEIRFFGRDKKHITNPLATTLLIPLVSIPQFLGVFFWNKFFATLWIALIFTLIFVCTYFVLMSVAKSPRIKNLSRVH
jgi:UDP-N-acetylmuramyl pentapeptide phosphotransferase/UDP-N-acetylglucosamine-1-phosphate transferase